MRLILLSALLAAIPAFAQAPADDAHTRAVAAGYKALTLCSAHFNAGRSKAQVETLELRGIYPEYEAQVRALQARVDEKHRSAGRSGRVANKGERKRARDDRPNCRPHRRRDPPSRSSRERIAAE